MQQHSFLFSQTFFQDSLRLLVEKQIWNFEMACGACSVAQYQMTFDLFLKKVVTIF